MKKKAVPKKVTRSRKNAPQYKIIGFTIISLGCVLLFLVGVLTYNFATQSDVLGSSTVLARGGDDSGGSGGSGSDSSSSSSSSGSGGSTSGSSGSTSTSGSSGSSGGSSSSGSGGSTSGTSGGDGSQTSGGTTPNISGGTTVNCTGPDGKVFVTTASSCESLNEQWHHPVSFTVVNRPPQQFFQSKPNENTEITQPKISIQPKQEHPENTESTELEAESADDSTKVNLKEPGTHVEIKNDNGNFTIKAKKPDGTEIELKDDTLDDVNKTFENENGPQIERNTPGTFAIKKNGTTASTNFPLSLDVNTHQLTVITPSGVKQVAVLPDQAVNNLIANGIITGVQQADTGNTIQLTETNNTPVFEVHGVSNQKLLGFIPDTIHRTVTVSAQDGSVTAVQESFTQEIIDLLSF